ncbi:MAG: hypothetical protein AB1489_23490, partial [Acidobacteriota bacterium]
KILLVILLSGVAVLAEVPAVSKDEKDIRAAKAAPRIVMAETDEYRSLRLQGFDALYNMDYQGARTKFQQMANTVPEHPAGYFYLATNLWLELLNNSRRLQTGLYSGESFYAETKEKVDPKLDEEFRRLTKLALERAEAAVKKNAADQEALYYQGAIHGLLASYEATVARSFISALRNGSRSVDLHRKVVELNPGYIDAYLTIGTYDYIVGSLPFFIKILATIGGIRGSRERGLEELRLVTERGIYANDDARVVLIALYAREKRYPEMLKLLETLSQKYPRNYVFKVERAATLVRLNRAEESYSIFEELLRDKTIAKVADFVHYQYGETLFGQGRHQDALNHFRAVIGLTDANEQLVTLAYLKAGQLHDLLQQRSEAMAAYETVLKRENAFDSHDQAKRYLKNPFRVK